MQLQENILQGWIFRLLSELILKMNKLKGVRQFSGFWQVDVFTVSSKMTSQSNTNKEIVELTRESKGSS